MNRFVSALLASSLVLAASAARADGFFGFEPSGCGSVVTTNMTPKWIWITIYDAFEWRHLDWGWVQPLGSRTWRSGNYSCAGIYHVRAEVKNNSGPQPADGPNIFDTRVELKGNEHNVFLKTPILTKITDAPPVFWTYASNTFWWDKNDTLPQASRTVPLPNVKVTNSAP